MGPASCASRGRRDGTLDGTWAAGEALRDAGPGQRAPSAPPAGRPRLPFAAHAPGRRPRQRYPPTRSRPTPVHGRRAPACTHLAVPTSTTGCCVHLRRTRAALPWTTLAVVALLASVVPVASSAQSLDDAREERAEVQARLDAAADRLDALETRAADLEAERDELTAEADELAAEVDELSAGIESRVIELFKRGTSRDPLTMLLSSDDSLEAIARAEAMQFVVAADVVEAERLQAARVRLDAVQERVVDREEALAEALAAQEQLTAELTDDLERAQELEARLEAEERARREEEERRRRAAAERRAAEERAAEEAQASDDDGSGGSDGGSSSGGGSTESSPAPTGSGGMACPVDNPRSFSDTWGAPRSGGRAHRGTDILAPYGTPVRAITSGTWSIQSPGPSAGLWAILRGDDGNQYWYMHLQSHTVANGSRVSAGQQTGTNGDTGNATGTPHVHFELHPGGGSATNPYPLLRSVC
ncbi:peptidoglycan DD-metalloendopeptidase family protein [Nitriliruptoraceae bacterium ZYF776]|nr:peptidoglycan DD-metalloendopeptidase family protein [Profundirhabdus halotolerans]